MYTTPIFYSMHMVPTWAKPVVLANPITHMVLCYQDVLYHGTITNPFSWLVFTGFSLILLGIGARSFVVLKIFSGMCCNFSMIKWNYMETEHLENGAVQWT